MIHIFATYTADWKPLVDLTTPLWIEYCERRGYSGHAELTPPEFPEHYSFTKTAAVRRKLEYLLPGDELFVIDLDMIPTNMKASLFEGAGEDLQMAKDLNGWNSGAYIIRPTERTKAWLDTIVALRLHGAESEQRAMWWINDAFGVEELPHPTINSIPYHEYEGFGFKKQDHPSQWEPGHFVCHLPGMTLDKRLEIFAKYIPQIQR